jgi:integrase
VGYTAVVRKHLIPELGSHRLTELLPEHLEQLYLRMMANGSRSPTPCYAHLTMRAALNLAVREGRLPWNPARSVKAPKGGQQR